MLDPGERDNATLNRISGRASLNKNMKEMKDQTVHLGVFQAERIVTQSLLVFLSGRESKS